VEIPKGDPRDPMEEGDIAGKVRRFAGGRDPDSVERVIRLARGLAELESIREFASSV